MQQQEIHNFLERYFIANNSPILKSEKGFLHVQLSIELDKALMNRPFYWHYLEKTGGVPNPMQMALITDPNTCDSDQNGEQIHFGSPRLHQIFQVAKQQGGYIRLYEKIQNSNGSTALHPWLCVNSKISYQCDRKKDILISIGLNLITGEIYDHFHELILTKSLTPKIPDYSFTLSPLISTKSGLNRLENVLRSIIKEDDHSWADEAIRRWEKDQQLLENFYEDHEEKPKAYHLELESLKEQYEPRIHIEIINGGIFYLSKQ